MPTNPSPTPAALLMWLSLVAFPFSASAAQAASSIFEALHGRWVGRGTLLGSPASFSMTWEVKGPLATLHFENATIQGDGTARPVLQAAATYRTRDAAEGVWLDSRGIRIELSWVERDQSLVVDWTAPDERGRTTYRVDGPGTVEVVDEVMSDGALVVFSRGRYAREEGSATAPVRTDGESRH